MKRETLLTTILILIFFSQSTCLGIENSSVSTNTISNGLVLYDNLISLPSNFLNRLLDEMQPFSKIEERVLPHYTAVDLYFGFNQKNSATLIFDKDGIVVGGLFGIRGTNLMIDSRTLVMANSSHAIFWNLETNETEYSAFIDYHHAFDYNPITDTFLVLGHNFTGTVEVAGENYTIDHDTISEIDREGKVVWHWNGAEYLQFDTEFFYLTNLTDEGYTADWTHGNSIYWDIAEDVIYYNARHISTVFKIDKTTKEILWQVGALNSDFTMYNVKGEEVAALFYGAHDIQFMGDNHFTIFDNDYLNLTNFASTHSRYIEFVIDEITWEAREVWTWNAPISHWTSSRGGVDKLPGGNFIGVNGGEGLGPIKNITEVDQNGNIVWEVCINNSVLHRSESFFKSPVIEVDPASLVTQRNQNTILNITVWNSYKNRIPEEAVLEIYEGDNNLLEENFVFLPDWQETRLSFEIPTANYSRGFHDLIVRVVNTDGFKTEEIISLKVKRASSDLLLTIISITIITLFVFRRKGK